MTIFFPLMLYGNSRISKIHFEWVGQEAKVRGQKAEGIQSKTAEGKGLCAAAGAAPCKPR